MPKSPTLALTVAVATTAALASPAAAGLPSHVQLTGSVSPADGATERRPRDARVGVAVTVDEDSRRTVGRAEVLLPRHVRLDGAGFPRCTVRRLREEGPAGCPEGSRVGTGTVSGAVGPWATPVVLDLEAHVAARRRLALALRPRGARSSGWVLPATVSPAQRPFGQVLSLDVPDALQQPAPGAYAYVHSVTASLGGRAATRRGRGRRKRSFAAVRGCPRTGAHQMGVELAFAANDAGPAGGTGIVRDLVECHR